MDDLTVKTKKRVSFGKVKVRFVFDYDYDENSPQKEDTVEQPSRVFSQMREELTSVQKQPKSILKQPKQAHSLSSGLDMIGKITKRNLECGTQDRNFWKPTKYSREKTEIPEAECNLSKNATVGNEVPQTQQEDNTETKNDQKPTSEKEPKSDFNKAFDKLTPQRKEIKTKAEYFVQERSRKPVDFNNNKFCVNENKVSGGKNTDENPIAKKNGKWQHHERQTPGLKTFVGIYSGIEADWEQTRQSLARIGVDVGEEKIKNPREFVAIMNVLLKMEKENPEQKTQEESKNEFYQKKRHNDADTLRQSKKYIPNDIDSSSFFKSPKPIDQLNTEKPPATEEETSIKLMEIPDVSISTKKKPKINLNIPRKKNKTATKVRKERSYSEDNLSNSSISTKYDNHSSLESFRKIKNDSKSEKKKSRSSSIDNTNDVQRKKTRGNKASTLMKEDSLKTREYFHEDNSMYKERSYSANDLDFPSRAFQEGSFRKTAVSMNEENPLQSKPRDRPKMKRDSWFMIREKIIRRSDPGLITRSNLRDGQKEKDKSATDSKEQLDDLPQEKAAVKVRERSASWSDGNNKNRSSKQKDNQNRRSRTKGDSRLLQRNEEEDTGSKKQCVDNPQRSAFETQEINRSKNEEIKKEGDTKVTLLTIAVQSLQSASKKDSEVTTTNTDIDSGLSSVNDDASSHKQFNNTLSTVKQLKSQPSSKAERVKTSKLVKSKLSRKNSELSGPGKIVEKKKNEMTAIDQVSETTEDDKRLQANSRDSPVTYTSQGQPSPSSVTRQPSVQQKSVGTSQSQGMGNESNGHTKDKNKMVIPGECFDYGKQNNEDCNSEDEYLFEKQFKDDICFINSEATKSMKNNEYTKRVQEKYSPQPKNADTNTSLKFIGAVAFASSRVKFFPFSN